MNVYDEYLKKEGLKIPHEGDVEGTVAAEMRNDAIERIFYGKTATAATADEEADWYGMLLKAEEIREKSEEEAQWYHDHWSRARNRNVYKVTLEDSHGNILRHFHFEEDES